MRCLFNKTCSIVLIIGLSHSASAENVYPNEASNLQSVEFGKLVKNYMIDQSSPSGWNFQTNNDIVWTSPLEWNNYTEQFNKSGYIRINFNGFNLRASPYNTRSSVLQEAAWRVTYSGNNIYSVNEIYIEHSTTAGMNSIEDNSKLEPFESLINENITYKPICFYKMIGKNYYIAYELSAPNKNPLYLEQSLSSGSGGLSTSYSLYLDKSDVKKAFNNYNDTNSKVCL